MLGQMLFTSALAAHADPDEAADALLEQLGSPAGQQPPDLVLAFVSGYSLAGAEALAARLHSTIQPAVLVGCTAEGVIGAEQEVEREPAVALLAAHLPGARLTPFSISASDWRDVLGSAESFRSAIGAPEDTKLFLLLADPFSSPMEEVLDAFNTHYAGIAVAGGMASAGQRPGGNRLFLNDRHWNAGAVGAALSGSLEVEVVVSQGCRPIGRPLAVTAAEDNVILGLEGEAPLPRLQSLFAELPDTDRELLQNGIFIGRAIDPAQEDLGRGDFLIRGVIGADQRSGAIAIGDHVREGEIVQFHLRDAATAQEDLEMLLLPQSFSEPPTGAFLFSCNGRGTRLYPHPNGDIRVVQQALGTTPLAGFFCAGEIGSIGGKNFLHGHTASMVLFRPAR